MGTADDFTAEAMPYLYQSEYFSLAWGKEHRGFYILPNGDKYFYSQPENWNYYKTKSNDPFSIAWGDETDLTIAPKLVIENIGNCNKYNSWFAFLERKTLLNAEIMNDLLTSLVINYGQQAIDAGIRANFMLIYNPELHLYKRTLLSTDGDRKVINSSVHTNSLINRFGTVR